MQIEFMFDYLSPFAYLAWQLLPTWSDDIPNLEIKFTPVLFAGLLNHWGQKGPAEIKPKRDYVFTQCLRIATRNNIPFTLPKFHPFMPIASLRLSLLELAGDQQAKVMAALWQAGWQEGRDLGDKVELAKILAENGITASLLGKTNEPAMKDQLKINTQRAIEKSVFGVPTFLTQDDQLFWGLDSMLDLKAHLKGQSNIDKAKLADILNRQSAVDRVR